MIEFDNVTKVYRTRQGEKCTLRNASFTIRPGQSIGICGVNGAGKSTLIRLMAGVEHPTSGSIRQSMTVSWPLGHSGAFQTSLTGADNVRFIARIYGRPYAQLIDQVEDFAELGEYLRMPMSTYSAGMRARLAFGVSLAIDFDCYLVDEITSVGDLSFQERCAQALRRRRAAGTLVMVSHSLETLRLYCESGATLIDGNLVFHDTVDAAIRSYLASQAEAA
jgi:capsular polysaccharide transport system ATP-binding protein